MGAAQFLDINSAKTTVISFPNTIGNIKPKEVIVCIPGNPGVPGFYRKFLQEIYNTTKLPVWVIGHACHDNTKRHEGESEDKKSERIFGLSDQLLHKIEFIEKYTSSETRVHLMGHSIGGWIVLEMLKNEAIKSRIASANLLFPTIQQMANSPSGNILNKYVRKVNFLIKPTFWVLHNLPSSFKKNLLILFYRSTGITLERRLFMENAEIMLDPHVAESIFHMAYDEMDYVVRLDIDTLIDNKDRINVLYGSNDGWAPKEWFLELKEKIPSMYMQELPFDHSFVMFDNEVAKIVTELIMKMK